MKCSRFFGLLVLFVFAFTFCSQGQGTTAVSDFQCFGGDTFATGLNDAGQVVGWVGDFKQGSGFVRNKGGGCEELPKFEGAVTIPLGINDRGQIVGVAFSNQDDPGKGFLYEKGVFTLIDYSTKHSDTCQTWAFSINSRGQIVGLYDIWKSERTQCDGPDKPFLREADGTLVDLPYPQDWPDSVQANGINPRGMIIGNYLTSCASDSSSSSSSPQCEYGFLRNPEGNFVPITPQGAVDTMPTGINPQGQIVGRYFTEPWLDAIGPCHSFFMDVGQVPVEIAHPDATYTCIGAINASGEVSGAWANTVNGPWHSFVVDIKALLPTVQ